MIELLSNFDPILDTLDIVVVAFLVYRLLVIVQGTRSVQIIYGFLVVFGAMALIELAELTTSLWLLNNILRELPLIVVILFQDEIRGALMRLGRGRFSYGRDGDDSQYIVEETVRAFSEMAQRRIGALVVFERKTGLADFAERATEVDAKLRAPILTGLFQTTNPLHDGAVIIRDGRIAAASAVLPLTERIVPAYFGTRHRAALGITEISDAIVIAASEERGELTLFVDGTFAENLSIDELRQQLYALLGINPRSH